MIVAAAIRIGEAIITLPKPARHHDVLRAINGLYWDHTRHPHTFQSEVQGFLTDHGEFLNRREAYAHAARCGQGTPRRDALRAFQPNAYDGEELFSEDLW